MIKKIEDLFLNLYVDVKGQAGIFKEDSFREMLTIERKRTERSKKPFLLMLIDITSLLAEKEPDSCIMMVIDSLHSSTREIDIKGWYKNGKVLGIIFTEVDAASQPYILYKIRASLAKRLNPNQAKLISITFSCFPDSQTDQLNPRESLDMFYPDIKEEQEKANLSQIKRAVDIIGSFILIVLLLPLFLAIALLVKITSKGPIVFKQTRLGYGGKEFTFLKFRSMHANADASFHEKYIQLLMEGESNEASGKNQIWQKLKNDPRITLLGRFLRKTSMDELPQLFNVLKGDMALVGPRPPIPYEYHKYQIWHKQRVLECKPGITGLWQVKGRSATTFDTMVRMDIQYFRQWSIWLDLKLLFQTPLAVFSTRGAA